MKKLLIAITLLLAVSSLKAQDKIYYKDGKSAEVKVIKVSETKIEFKKWSDQDGATHEISLDKITMVVYQNGEHQNFNTVTNNSKRDQNGKKIKEFRRNRINGDILTYASNGRSVLSYERLIDDGSKAIELEFGLWKGESNGDWVGYTFGLNYKFYTSGNGRGFYVAPSIGAGVIDWYINDYYYASSEFSAFGGAKIGYQFQISSLFGLYLSATANAVSNFDDVVFGGSGNFGLNFSFN